MPHHVDTGPTDLLWRKLFKHLHAGISSGALAGGSKLPSEQDLCKTHKVSRITVRRALRELEVLGLLKRQRGAGTEVVAPRNDDLPRLIHVVMSPSGHVLSDIHQALMTRLGELGFSHQTWTPVLAQSASGPDAIAAAPARGTIIVPWNVDATLFQQNAARLGRVVTIVPDAGQNHGLPGLGIDFIEPISELLTLARKQRIRSVLHMTYRDRSDHRAIIASALLAECIKHDHNLAVVANFDSGAPAELAELQAALEVAVKPVLVVCASDYIARSVMKLLTAMRWSVPKHASVVGIFDTPHSQVGNLSTISVRPWDLVDGAIALIIKDRSNMAFTRLPGQLIIRGTGPGTPSSVAGPLTS